MVFYAILTSYVLISRNQKQQHGGPTNLWSVSDSIVRPSPDIVTDSRFKIYETLKAVFN
jgi:hypothetical protein